jgi:hypothetical protein
MKMSIESAATGGNSTAEQMGLETVHGGGRREGPIEKRMPADRFRHNTEKHREPMKAGQEPVDKPGFEADDEMAQRQRKRRQIETCRTN